MPLTRVGNSLIVFLSNRSGCSFVQCNSQLLFRYERPERITHVDLLFRATWAIGLQSLFIKEQMSEERWEQFALWHKKGGKLPKTYEKWDFFEFVKSNLSDSLMVAVLLRGTREPDSTTSFQRSSCAVWRAQLIYLPSSWAPGAKSGEPDSAISCCWVSEPGGVI